jgi:hypothetical protein
VADRLGDSDLGTITYRELKTIIYLSLSTSGFLTILSARTRGAFFSRRTGGYLGAATVVAFIVTNLMAVGVESISTGLDMDNLAWKQVLFVWVWVLIWFIIQDCFLKVAAYKAIDWYYAIDKSEEQVHNILSTNIEEERLTQRRTSMGVGGRGNSILTASSANEHGADSGVHARPSRVTFDAKMRASQEKTMRDSYDVLASKFAKLEEEMSGLRRELANKKDKKK